MELGEAVSVEGDRVVDLVARVVVTAEGDQVEVGVLVDLVAVTVDLVARVDQALMLTAAAAQAAAAEVGERVTATTVTTTAPKEEEEAEIETKFIPAWRETCLEEELVVMEEEEEEEEVEEEALGQDGSEINYIDWISIPSNKSSFYKLNHDDCLFDKCCCVSLAIYFVPEKSISCLLLLVWENDMQ